MRSGGFRVEVERFDLTRAGDDADESAEARFEAWVSSQSRLDRMRLVVPGATALDLEEIDTARTLGTLRLIGTRRTLAPAPPPADCARATLLLGSEAGDLLEIPVGDSFGLAPHILAAAPEDVPVLTLGDDADWGELCLRRGLAGATLFAPGAAPDPWAVADAFADDFAGLGDPDDLLLTEEGGAWFGTSQRYGFRLAVGDPAAADEQAARDSLASMIQGEVARLREALAAPAVLLVRAAAPHEADDEAARDALADACRGRNPAATLLWARAGDDQPATRVAPGLLSSGLADPEATVEAACRLAAARPDNCVPVPIGPEATGPEAIEPEATRTT